MIARVLRERGRSWQFPEEDRIGSNRYSKLRDDPSAMRLRPNGDETQTLQGIAKRRKRSAARRTVRKSQCPIVALKRGNGPFRTPWSEGGAALWTGSWNHAEDTEPHQRVTAKRLVV